MPLGLKIYVHTSINRPFGAIEEQSIVLLFLTRLICACCVSVRTDVAVLIVTRKWP